MSRPDMYRAVSIVFVLLSFAVLSSASLVPEAISVPNGNVLAHVIYANGLFVYTCYEDGGAWQLSNAYADLYYSRGAYDLGEERIGVYDQLPVADSTWGLDRWTLYPPLTETSVVARKEATVPQATSAAFELYSTTQVQGPGIFAEVTYIQRTYTEGGAPPAGTCATAGLETTSTFGAEYWFYTAGRMPYSAASSLRPFGFEQALPFLA